MKKFLGSGKSIILTGIILLGILSCDSSDNCCTLIDVDVRIHYQTPASENLINSSDDFDASKIRIYYKEDDEYDYVFYGNYTYPNMHYVYEDENEDLILTVFASNRYQGNFSTTLIELNPNVVDTLLCEFELDSNREICKNVWLNGEEMGSRYFEVVR